MGLLFKTTLVHVKKNSFVVFVLSFFIASGTTVLASSNLLTDNLYRGFQEVNFDSNPHDLVLMSKSFKSDQNLNAESFYVVDLSKFQMRPNWGYRWAFENLKDDFYVKAAEFDKVEEKPPTAKDSKSKPSPSQPTSPPSSPTSNGPKLRKLDRFFFYIPRKDNNDFSFYNQLLVCKSEVSFFESIGSAISLTDHHKSGYSRHGLLVEDERDYPDSVQRVCSNGRVDKFSASRISSVFDGIGQHYFHHIAQDSRPQPSTASSPSPSSSPQSLTLTDDELLEFHTSIKAFNPRIIWYSQTPNNAFPFMGMWEPDHFLSFHMPFQLMMGNTNLAPKFRQLVTHMTSPNIYYRLDDQTQQQIVHFKNTNLFNRVHVRFWLSAFSRALEYFSAWLPMFPGMTYAATAIMFLKMFLWDYISDPSKTIQLESDMEKDIVDDDEIGRAKQAWKKNIESWDEGTTKGLDSWNPLQKLFEDDFQDTTISKDPEKGKDAASKTSLYTKQSDFVFSTLRPQATLSDAQKFALSDYLEWKTDKADNANDLKGKSVPYLNNQGQTLIKAIKDTLIKWIDGDYYSDKSTSKTNIIPAFASLSGSMHKEKENTANYKPFADASQNAYRNFPHDFASLYAKLRSHVYRTLQSYLTTLSTANLKIVKQFIGESEIFTLSFLLHNFAYDPAKSLEVIRRKKQGKPKVPPLDKDISITIPKLVSRDYTPIPPAADLSPSINYHKSLVVVNPQDKDSPKLPHSYKVIAQVRKDNSYVNRLKILSGNYLFSSPLDILTSLNKFKSNQFEFRNFYNVVRRMKYQDDSYRDLISKYAAHFENPYDEAWVDGQWLSKDDLITFEKDFLKVFKWSGDAVSKQGSRIVVSLSFPKTLNFTRTFSVHTKISPPPILGHLDQFSAYFAVVSPSYAHHNGIVPISNEKYNHFKRLVESDATTQDQWEKEYASFVYDSDNQKHLINVNGNRLIIVGIGMSPDMLLPSHSYLNLVPKKDSEALVFVDKYGYERIKHNSLSSWDEYYLSISYPQHIKQRHLEDDYYRQMFDYIQEFVGDEILPDGSSSSFDLRAVKGAPLNQLVYLRSQYVDRFMFAVSSMFNLVLSFMGLVVFFTVWVLVKRYISASLNTFGVFVANGISKFKIILNASLFVLIPALAGVVVGYLLALGLQPVIFGLLSNVWYLTPTFMGFSASRLMFYMLISAAIFGPLSWLCSFFILRGDVNRLMKMNIVFRQNRLTQFIYSRLHSFSSLWKFRLSVIVNTAGRGFILSSATVFLFVFTSFLFNNFGQFRMISDNEIDAKHYGFSMALETPTLQSGQPPLVSYSNLGDTLLDGTKHSRTVDIQVKPGQWEPRTIDFDHTKPEVIGSGLKSVYFQKDIQQYMTTCKDLDIRSMYDRLGIMDFDYPGNNLEVNPYNLYLFGKYAEKKQDVSIDCSQPIESSYTATKFGFVPQDHALAAVFNTSKKGVEAQSSTKFDPSIEQNNRIEYLGDYVPIEQERRASTNGKNGSSTQPYTMIKYGNEPLFSPLIEYYKTKKPLLPHKSSAEQNHKSYDFISIPDTAKTTNQGSSTTTKLSGDFITFEGGHKHPTLSRLFRDHSNYWLFTYLDLASIRNQPTFLKNKVLLPILFNHNWTFTLFGTTISFNPWTEFSEFFAKYSTELAASLESNYSKFVESIIKSRYGAFFVNRFMDKHVVTNVDAIVHEPGKLYWNKPTWKVTQDLLSEHNKSKVDAGLYWINPSKLVYFHEKLQSVGVSSPDVSKPSDQTSLVRRHPDRFVVFRPDFLYLIYAILKDAEFQKDDTAPMKVTFHNNVYVPDYSNNSAEFQVTGDPDQDRAQPMGLTASDPSISSADYGKIPNGDQTYTYLKTHIKGLDGVIDVIGIKQDRRGSYVRLSSNGKSINHRLYREPFSDGSHPIIINQYTAKKLNLHLSSPLEMQVINSADRFTRLANGRSPSKTAKFRVVGIYDSYYKPAFFIGQRSANIILGLDPEYGYNGIHTRRFDAAKSLINDLPVQLTRSISGYSPSGIYARQKINKNDSAFHTFLQSRPQNILSSSPEPTAHPLYPRTNEDIVKSRLSIGPESSLDTSELAALLERLYGDGYSLASSIVGLENASLFNDFVFNTVSDLIISVINLFITIFTPLLVFALLVITNLIIEDLKNLLTILNLLGFTYTENSVTILLYLGIILTFSTIMALPIASALLSFYVQGVFTTLSIYLPIALRFDYALASFTILLFMFGFSYYMSLRKIKSLYLPVAMKSLNE